MQGVKIVQLHSLFLFALSDHVTRDSDVKFGIMLGLLDSNNNIVISTSFEILFTSSLTIDFEYLNKRLIQFQTVLPQYSLIGIYQITNDLSPNSATISVLEQVAQFKDHFECSKALPLVYTLIGLSILENENKDIDIEPFKSYLYNQTIPLTTVILVNDTENIAASTIANRQDYFSSGNLNKISNNETKIWKHNEELSISINQLYHKVSNIMNYLESYTYENDKDVSKTIEINNLINQLSNRLLSFQMMNKGSKELRYNHQLQTSYLSLLTEHLSVLDELKTQIAKNAIKYHISKYQISTSAQSK